jgi:hypothetical protein
LRSRDNGPATLVHLRHNPGQISTHLCDRMPHSIRICTLPAYAEAHTVGQIAVRDVFHYPADSG